MVDLSVFSQFPKYLYGYGGLLLIVVGTVSCVGSLFVFAQKNFRRSTGSIYFIAVNITNLLFIYSLVLALTLSIGFNIDPASAHGINCRLIIYCTYLIDSLNSFYLILASIDRVFVTSSSAHVRRHSTRRCAWTSLIIGTLFWTLFHIPALILTDVLPAGPGLMLCLPQPGYYTEFVGYYLLLLKGILFPLLMGIFCIWTVKNIYLVRLHRVMPSSNNPPVASGIQWSLMRSRDRHFALMLAINLSIYILFTLPLSISSMYIKLQPSTIQNFDLIRLNQFIRVVVLFISYIPHCLDFYENLIVSKTFRKEVKPLAVSFIHTQ